MIERVAKAIALSYDYDPSDEISIAKAAIKAMKEPTQAMLDAGAYDLDMTLERQYKNMIEAALKDD
jgi:hypothetical protein